MALQSDLDTAAEAVTNAKASLQSAKSSLEQTKQQLIIMMGWNYNDSVEIGSLPDVDTSVVSKINVTSDIQTAIANNYSVKITGAPSRKLPVGEQPRDLHEHAGKPEGDGLHKCEECLQQSGSREGQL